MPLKRLLSITDKDNTMISIFFFNNIVIFKQERLDQLTFHISGSFGTLFDASKVTSALHPKLQL